MRPALHGAASRPEDVVQLHLRPEDAAEVSEGWRELCAQAIEHGTAQTYRDASGAVVGIFGVTYPGPDQVSPWLLCSPLVEQHKRELMRRARRMVAALRRVYPETPIFNHIPKDSAGNRRFIRSLGFRIVPSRGAADDLFFLPLHV